MGTVFFLSAFMRGLRESTARGVVIGGFLGLTVICMAAWQVRSRNRRISFQLANGFSDREAPLHSALRLSTSETFRKIGCGDLIHPEDRESVTKELQHRVVCGSSYAATYRMGDTHGVYRWFEVHAEPLRNAEGTPDHRYCVLADVNVRRQLQAEVLQTRQGLAKASHVAAVAELSASIAHEICQPLSALTANADACERWLATDPPNIERARRSLGSIQRDIARADGIVRRMRALFKQKPPIKVPLNINEVITEVHDLLLEENTKRGATFVLDLATPIPMTLADGIQIQQVLVNLIHNALDAIAGAGRPAGKLVIRSRQEGSSLVVEVLDNGAGFQDAARLFDAFFTTKADGMGMGLAICHSIIEAHGGRIWAERGTPVGSVFSFSIPILM
jgi:C4-dicarboxylate-specific signal transduction histidine kinase